MVPVWFVGDVFSDVDGANIEFAGGVLSGLDSAGVLSDLDGANVEFVGDVFSDLDGPI